MRRFDPDPRLQIIQKLEMHYRSRIVDRSRMNRVSGRAEVETRLECLPPGKHKVMSK
jgi:hypothetical protein